MIEGLRVLPAYQDACNAEAPIVPGAKGCEECKRTVTVERRQDLACGWEPAKPGARPWTPPGIDRRGGRLSTCPGYTTRLPVVAEATNAYPQWELGTLTEYLDGEPPDAVILDCLKALRAGIREHEAEQMRAATEKGRA